MMVVRRVLLIPALALAATLMLTAACSGDDDDPAPGSTRPLPVSGDDIGPGVGVDDSPFCRTMLEIGDDEDLSLDEIVARYVDVADDVPDEIRPDFDVVLERLVAVTSDDDTADALDDAVVDASRFELAAFIDRRCRGTSSNPLPPPTVPE